MQRINDLGMFDNQLGILTDHRTTYNKSAEMWTIWLLSTKLQYINTAIMRKARISHIIILLLHMKHF